MPTVALAMIVRDEPEQLAACLRSASDWIDECVVGHTGSAGATVAVAQAAGARVIAVPWRDDFAAARNQVLENVHSDWVLVLDADERLEAGPAWRGQMGAGADAFQVTIRNYVRHRQHRLWDRPAQPNDGRWPEATAFPAFVEHENVRLFRRRPELYFVGRVHESVGPRVEAAGLRLGKSPSLIHHFGLALEPEAQAAKNRHYRQLGRLKAEERPGDAQAQFEVGLVELDQCNDPAAALADFERAVAVNSRFGLAWFFAGVACDRLGRGEAALERYARAAQAGYRSPLLAQMRGDALYRLARFEEAAREYRRALDRNSGDGCLRSKLGLAELRRGRRQAGMKLLQQAVEAAPVEANYDRLITAHVFVEDLEGALLQLERRMAQFPEDRQSHVRAAAILRQLGRGAESAAQLQAAAAAG